MAGEISYPRQLSQLRLVVAATLLTCVPLAGCAPSLIGKKDLIAFLDSGKTAREDVYLHLGAPSAAFEGTRILTYRLDQDDGGYFVVRTHDGIGGVRYSLVLVFDRDDMVQEHALVDLGAP